MSKEIILKAGTVLSLKSRPEMLFLVINTGKEEYAAFEATKIVSLTPLRIGFLPGSESDSDILSICKQQFSFDDIRRAALASIPAIVTRTKDTDNALLSALNLSLSNPARRITLHDL